MELGPQSRNRDGLLGPNSRIVVYMDPLGNFRGTQIRDRQRDSLGSLDSKLGVCFLGFRV